MDKELFLVTGASGKLGAVFIKTLLEKSRTVVGLSRRKIELNTEVYICDLLNENEVVEALSKLDYTLYDTITFIHTVGKFKFEKDNSNMVDVNSDGIDDEVYSTNVVTLKNVLKFLTTLKNKNLKVCAFASVSDKYDIPFWISYKKAKTIMKEYLKELSESGILKALIINVSTIDTGNENLLRPEADKTYWLQPHEVVDTSIAAMDSLSSYTEIDVVKPKPDFNKNYYLDHDAILNKWKKEMGLEP